MLGRHLTPRTIALGLVLALVASPCAVAQGTHDGIELNGLWKLEKMDGNPAPAYVVITHQGRTVKGEFSLGGECFDGTPRESAIDGRLSTTITPGQIQYGLTGTMWVCTNSPHLIEQCGGKLSSAYEARILEATVQQNRISGTRVAQGVLDCRPNSAWDGTYTFALTRNACTKLELDVAIREEFLSFLQSQATRHLDVFVTAHSAARARYGDGFTVEGTTWRTDWLQTPYFELRRPHASAEAFFEHLRQVLSTNPDRWLSAKTTAQMMARDGLTEAAAVVTQMHTIDEAFVEARTTIEELKKFRTDLDACRRANPSANPSASPSRPR